MTFSNSSNPSDSGDCLELEIAVDCLTRWDIYIYLQEYSIPCKCGHGQPLRVQVGNAAAAIQLWSIFRVFTASKQAQVQHLKRCWRKEIAT
ncbi:MAG: Asr1405/Asl0597 family protein [Cyanobacteria bacterium P01_C01_bin.120]